MVYADRRRITDNDKLNEKVNEALAVFNEYQKTQQKGDATGPQEASQPNDSPADGETEEAKA